MRNHYISPYAKPIENLSEPNWRNIIAAIILLPPRSPHLWMQKIALSKLFQLECGCAQNTLCTMRRRRLQPQPYNAPFGKMLTCELYAAKRLLAPHRRLLIDGTYLKNTVLLYPRYLVLAVHHLLLNALQTDTPLSVHVNGARFSVCINRSFDDETLIFARTVAALHGGRVLQSGTHTVMQLCPQKENAAYPRHVTTTVNDILKNPISAANAAYASLGIIG